MSERLALGIVSDTHGHVANTRAAVELLAEWDLDEVLHCGDIGSPEVVALFAAWPTHFVLGNVDRDEGPLPEAIAAAGQTCHGRFGQRTLAGKRISFLHGDDTRLLRQLVESGDWDLVCYGHTHRPEWKSVAQTKVLNPGALYRARPHSFAVLELPSFQLHPLTV